MNVRRVAGEEELQRLREGLTAAQVDVPEDIETMRADLMARLQRPLDELMRMLAEPSSERWCPKKR